MKPPAGRPRGGSAGSSLEGRERDVMSFTRCSSAPCLQPEWAWSKEADYDLRYRLNRHGPAWTGKCLLLFLSATMEMRPGRRVSAPWRAGSQEAGACVEEQHETSMLVGETPSACCNVTLAMDPLAATGEIKKRLQERLPKNAVEIGERHACFALLVGGGAALFQSPPACSFAAWPATGASASDPSSVASPWRCPRGCSGLLVFSFLAAMFCPWVILQTTKRGVLMSLAAWKRRGHKHTLRR